MLISETLKQKFPHHTIATHQYAGDDTLIVRRKGLFEIAKALKEDSELDFQVLMDITCVDYLKFDHIPSSQPGTATPSPLPFFMKPHQGPQGSLWERPKEGQTRFEVVYHFYSLTKRHRIRIKVPLQEGETELDSLTPLWVGADWLEREVWDMFGVVFKDHPNLKRILMYESFEGHPLRKDYPINKRQPLIGPVN